MTDNNPMIKDSNNDLLTLNTNMCILVFQRNKYNGYNKYLEKF